MAVLTQHSIIDQLRAVMPGQPMAWYERIGYLIEEGVMPMPMIGSVQVVETYRSPPQPPTTSKPQPEPPPNVVSEETKAKLLALCKSPEMAESYVAAERRWANSEERAWQRAFNKLTEENEQHMAEKVKLYSNFGFYS
jgi:hypothetical protein